MNMDNRIALHPQHSVIVEACAGSGKTWLLVSRIVRLLLAGVRPDEILAITFTRKAAQEMQARLNEWLHFLATQSDDEVRAFLQAREMYEVDADILARARNLYRESLLVQPSITINTFHGWFMQIVQSAPLNSNVPLGMNLLEHTSALQDEAWQEFTNSLQAAPESEISLALQWLFAEYGLHSTQTLLNNFLHKRAEWWAYVSERNDEHSDAVAFALQQLRDEFGVEESVDPITELFADDTLQHAINNFSNVLATDGTDKQRNAADSLKTATTLADIQQRYAQVTQCLYTKADEPRIFTPTKKQNAESFISAHEVLLHTMQVARDALMARTLLRLNTAALRCGATLLQHYQDLKLRHQQIDFVDVEWQVCHLLRQGDYAEYMQYKLDSRYSHVLLDEFQDTNPVQWQVLQAWFAAAEAVQSRPTVFVVGDPKQSIYRFRRADARLFGEVSGWLQNNFDARYLSQNITRRNAPAILNVVNKIFEQHPNGFIDFETHSAHQTTLLGQVEVLPLLASAAEPDMPDEPASKVLQLRNPLFTARAEKQSDNRELEASQFAEKITDIVAHWQVSDSFGVPRPAEFSDIMVLVRKRLHLQIYEHALRQRHIPFLTSRRGGLLNTLETEDIQALLIFLITPFADLQLAQTLRSPLFACADTDLMQLAATLSPHCPPVGCGTSISTSDAQPKHCSWWQRLQQLVAHEQVSPELLRAHQLLSGWIKLADKLPVHDLLDHIYFEADVVHRYVAALPIELHESVRANLQAFMEIALNVDAGRYPSLPRFLIELQALRQASDNEAPDEGRVGKVGNAIRIYTVHEAKGLEAPIVWLLDANDTKRRPDGYNVLLDWPPNKPRPTHFSLFTDKRDSLRANYFAADEAYAQREEMNLLYVAMTRAKQALLVSGHGKLVDTSWYGRIAQATSYLDSTRENNAPQGDNERSNPLLSHSGKQIMPSPAIFKAVDSAPQGDNPTGGQCVLQRPIPTGQREPRVTSDQYAASAQQQGTWLHALLQHLAPSESTMFNFDESLSPCGINSATKIELQQRCTIPEHKIEALWQQAQNILRQPTLQIFFDPRHYRTAYNELSYITALGELRRIDRLVEFENEVWVLDYKTGETNPFPHSVQMQEYRDAMQAIYTDKMVRCGLLFAEGVLHEVT